MFKFSLRRRTQSDRGFTLIDMLATTAIVATVGAVAIPQIKKSMDGQQLGIDVRNVEREMQTARLDAVKANQPIRIRFNCPDVGTYRRVELMGTVNAPANGDDSAANAIPRCRTNGPYPYPAADRDPLTRPNNDGPIQRLNSQDAFLLIQTLEFWPNGSVHTDSGTAQQWPVIGSTPVKIRLNRGSTVKEIQVNGLGKIQIQ